MRELILILDRAGRCLNLVPASAPLLAQPPAAVLGKTLAEIFPPQQAELFLTHLCDALAARQPVTCECRLPADDGERSFSVTLTPLADETVLFVAHDMSAEGSVRDSEERYRILAETAIDGIITINSQSQIVDANKAAEKIFGYRAGEMTGQCLHILIPESLRKIYDAAMRRYAETRPRFDSWPLAEYLGLHRTGREIPLEISFSEFTTDGELYLTGTIRDISERKETAERLRQMNLQLLLSQKLEAVGRLTGGIAHEFRNLLTSINMHTGFLRKKLGEEESLQRHTRGISEASQRAKTITDQLLAFSRREMRSPVLLDLHEEIRNFAGTTLPQFPGVRIELNLSPEPYAVLIDQTQLGQVLLNLLLNAHDAMPHGGEIKISTSGINLDEGAAERRGILSPGRYVRIAVTDTGVGMGRETQGRIFEPFFTTKEVGQGTGLGLSMVYGIVKASKGYVLVESEPDQGATFEVLLPWVEDGRAAQESLTAGAQFVGYKTILLVEDEQSLRELMKDELRESGYCVLDARHGEEGLQIAESYLGQIDLIITDLKMPEMDGEELVERLGATRPEMKVLFISGFPPGSFKAGTDVNFLHKPFPIPLSRKVHEIFATPNHRA
ncbi:PAS domain S-box protein [soil metagenome]